MKSERVLVIACSVILLATMLAVSLASQTTWALSGNSPASGPGDAAAANGPTFDSSILLPAIFRGGFQFDLYLPSLVRSA